MMCKYRIDDFESDVRAILRDGGTTPYYASDVICRAVVDAFRRLYSVRPVARLPGVAEPEFPSDAASLAAFEVTLDSRWRVGIVYYAAARCYDCDVTDTVKMQLSANLKQQADMVFAS